MSNNINLETIRFSKRNPDLKLKEINCQTFKNATNVSFWSNLISLKISYLDWCLDFLAYWGQGGRCGR